MANYRTITVGASLSTQQVQAAASIADMTITAGATISTPVAYSPLPHYEGAYVVTPTRETQTLMTKERAMTANVIINPIPSNYGLITWNGSSLTVS